MMALAQFLKLEQVKAMYGQITPSLLKVAITVYTISLIALWPVFDKVTLIVWYISGIVITILRKRSAMKFTQSDIAIENCQPWIKSAIFWAFLSGISWGFIFVFFTSPEHFFRLLFLLGLFGGLISLSASNFGSFFPVYFAFSSSLTLLFVSKLFFIGGDLFYIAGTLVFAYFIEMTSIALNTQNAFNKSAELQFFNNTLLTEVVAQKEAAENAVHSKNQFLAAASHDLRQPLHAQGLFVDALKELNLDKDAAEIVTKIQSSTSALNGLLNSLLDISRLDAESIQYQPQSMELNPILSDLINEYSEQAQEKNINFNLNFQGSIIVKSDKALLTRLIRNLIDNAIKFTNNGEISISVKSHYKKVELTINDTGCGIPEHEKCNIFNEFTQLDNPERDRQKGLGLGLAIVKRLAHLMGIKIRVESILNLGTSFNLTIPASVLSSIELKKQKSTSIQNMNSRSIFNNETILVIDDEKDILEGMEFVVNNWGANIITADDCDSAIKKLHEKNLIPNLIIADFRLRENKNGISAINKIREYFDTKISVILVTGDTAPDRLQLALSADATVLHKPVTPNLLRETAHKILSTTNIS